MLWACEGAYAQFSTADVLRVDGKPPHLGLCRRGFNLIGKIQPVLIGWNVPDGVECSRWGGMFPMGWNVPDEVERWHNQAVEAPEVGFGVRGDGLLKLGTKA